MLSLVTCFPGPLSRVSKVPRYHDPSRKDSNGTEDDDRGLMDERSEELNGEGIIRLQELTSHSLVTSHLTPSPPVPFPSGEARPLRGEEGTGREKGTEGGMEVGTRKPTHFQGWFIL